ncbi:alpha/beta hydrolase [Streptomyces rugosispiralis]|uniref:Alpha/beta hydrolase-fold protein n=1 Tax=Streptomyces rugosispiralis TaxID=2967341 RepID=A0ABT1US54_9ACTN|nr:alpha/beta hydrolase-fold protein [Streptomyces rugosispiralis]MCQ8187836.1 alpha/beta hydrolase-fold protein [Streptomyces rugosispiralis]
MKMLSKAVLRGRSPVLLGLAALMGLFLAAPAQAATAPTATAPPHFANGHGLTVISQPKWADDNHRTFVLTVRTAQVPVYDTMADQVSGEHVIMVTLPTGYSGTANARYPVLYDLPGAGEYPNSVRYLSMAEGATENVPLITVTPNGGGRGWYTDWVHPGSRGRQNWETFHLDQVIPFIDANLRTVPTRQGRAITGHSMGGFGAFHYAEDRPELFRYVGSFSGDLDMRDAVMRAAVTGSELLPGFGTPTAAPDAVFGPPVWPLDGTWNKVSPAQHVAKLRGMGVALYAGDGGDLSLDPNQDIQALAEAAVHRTAVTTAANLTAAGIPYRFADYSDGSNWAEGCTGKHAQDPCLRAGMNDFVRLIMKRVQHP